MHSFSITFFCSAQTYQRKKKSLYQIALVKALCQHFNYFCHRINYYSEWMFTMPHIKLIEKMYNVVVMRQSKYIVEHRQPLCDYFKFTQVCSWAATAAAAVYFSSLMLRCCQCCCWYFYRRCRKFHWITQIKTYSKKKWGNETRRDEIRQNYIAKSAFRRRVEYISKIEWVNERMNEWANERQREK